MPRCRMCRSRFTTAASFPGCTASASRKSRATTSATCAQATSGSAQRLNEAIASGDRRRHAAADLREVRRLERRPAAAGRGRAELAAGRRGGAVALGELPHYAQLLLRAAWTTVQLSFLSMPLAMLLGLLVAIGRLYGPAWVRWPLEAYVELLRGTPLLLAAVRDLLRAAAIHRREPAGVLGRRAGPGDQLLGLRGGELPRRPAGHSARADGGRPVARHEHAAPRCAA